MRFKGVIFDLDGTLVNSLEDIADSMNIVLRKYGFPTHNLQAYKYLVGNGIRNLVSEALPEVFREEKSITRCFDLMMKEYRNNCLNKTHPYEGIVDLLNELTTRELKLAIFSNKADDLTQKVVGHLLANWNFEVIMGASPEIPRKPNPLGAFLISRKLGVNPEDLIFVGDTDVDMKTANKAGMFAVGALWGFRTKEELTDNGAKYLLNYPLELIRILKETKVGE
jgi:phosphoglycolate phosphatase